MADQPSGDAGPVLPLAFLSFLSCYGLYLSYNNITRLREYEATSEKAAKWSNTAAERLHKTRTTQTSGTVSLLVSALTSFALLFDPKNNKGILLGVAILNVAALFASRSHMGKFWNDKEQTQVPFVEKFNEAIKGSESVVSVLGLLCFGWLDGGLMWLFGWDSGLGANLFFGASVSLWAALTLDL